MEIKDVFGNLPTLETARLLLRKMNHDDAQDLFEYASDPEVAKYTIGFCTMQLNRVQAICEAENVASARVMEIVGMTFEGRLREYMPLVY